MTDKTGKLYLVGTPIGNLGDMTLRAIATLKTADAIACEDTRRTRALLAHFGIPACELLSLHAQSEESRAVEVIELLEAGKTVAYVTDAGMPTVSDPGRELVTIAYKSGITVEVVPGVSASTTALAYVPFASARFAFEGFLPRKGSDRNARLKAIAERDSPSIVFESPARINALLDDLTEYCDSDRCVVIARELTKLHEQVVSFKLADRATVSFPEKGEFTVVIEGAREKTEDVKISAPERKQIAASVVKLRREGVSNRDILKVLRTFLPNVAPELRDLVLKDNDYD